ncbi:MAG: hypothetical protein MJ127_00240 [Mogibacterium sp.]|nr:hypothetical protein [Mogibacterium sp.]
MTIFDRAMEKEKKGIPYLAVKTDYSTSDAAEEYIEKSYRNAYLHKFGLLVISSGFCYYEDTERA